MTQDPFDNLGAQVRPQLCDQFDIESVTLARDGAALVFSGNFVGDSASAFDRIQARLHAIGLMALAQRDRARTLLTVVHGLPAVKPSRATINLLLLVATVVTTTMVGAQYSQTCTGALGAGLNFSVLAQPLRMLAGLPFSLGVLSILGTHELGHYFLARRHRIAVTLPYFIPLPIGLGTMGAFIKLKGPLDSRRSLFDVGAAGPLAGLVVAVPVFLIGLLFSDVRFCGRAIFGSSVFLDVMSALVLGVHARGWVTVMHPLAYAGWVGFLMTGLNLLPIGQLDGGHVAYAIFGRYAAQLARVTFAIMVLITIIYPGWFLWVLLVFFVGLRHPPPLNDVTPLDWKRRVLGIATLIFAILIFIPVPFNVRGLF